MFATVEFVCARICCSRFFLGTLFFFAMVCQAMTFFILVSEDFWYVICYLFDWYTMKSWRSLPFFY